jgi:hypothetical protein
MDHRGAALGLWQHDPIRTARHHREIVVGEPGRQSIDAHVETRPTVVARRSLEERERAFARGRLALGRDRILQVEDQRIGAAREPLLELALAVGGDEQEGTHGRFVSPIWRACA